MIVTAKILPAFVGALLAPKEFSSLPWPTKVVALLTSPFNPLEMFEMKAPELVVFRKWLSLSFACPLIALGLALVLQGERWKRAFFISVGGALAASYMASAASWLYRGVPSVGPSVVAVDLLAAALVMTAVAVDKYKREASRTPRRIQSIRSVITKESGFAIAIVAISVYLLFSAFY
ncbi:MAG: hypothetical protein ACP5UK_03620, partial [Conexivisphaera sp.]